MVNTIKIPPTTEDWLKDLDEQAKYCYIDITHISPFRREPYWVCELMYGEPCVYNGVGNISNCVKFHGKGKTIELAFRDAQNKNGPC